jgi:hypothetical protein
MRALLKHAKDLFSARFYRPSHLRLGLRDCFDLRTPLVQLQPNSVHIAAAMSWLCAAHDGTNDGGVSARYRLDRGWAPSYPETTGYIIPTFLAHAKRTGEEQFRGRAVRMADWLLQVQLECGAFPGHDVDKTPQPIVFNTGQIMLGLLAAFRETEHHKYLRAAIRAGDWLVAIQEPNGSWLKHTYLNRVHTYHTRVAWPLLELWVATGREQYRQAAIKNLDWALGKQLPNGWFRENGFSDNEKPYLHTIAYTVRGLLACDEILREHDYHGEAHLRYFNAAMRAAEAVMHRFEVRRYPYAQYDCDWKSAERFSCLTGNAQIAKTWLNIYAANRDPRFLNAALKINDFVKSTQDLVSRNPGIRGGIKGSHPIWARYIRYSFPNWAAKFFVDALALEDEIMARLAHEERHEFGLAVQTA